MSRRTYDVGPGFVRAKECPDCGHTHCGNASRIDSADTLSCVCNCDAARAEEECDRLRSELSAARERIAELEEKLRVIEAHEVVYDRGDAFVATEARAALSVPTDAAPAPCKCHWKPQAGEQHAYGCPAAKPAKLTQEDVRAALASGVANAKELDAKLRGVFSLPEEQTRFSAPPATVHISRPDGVEMYVPATSAPVYLAESLCARCRRVWTTGRVEGEAVCGNCQPAAPEPQRCRYGWDACNHRVCWDAPPSGETP